MTKATCCKSSPNPSSIAPPSSLKSSNAKAHAALAKATSKPSSKPLNGNRNSEETCKMKLVTFRTADHATHAGVVRDDRIITLDYPSVLELLRDPEGLTRLSNVLAKEDIPGPTPIAEAPLGILMPVFEAPQGKEYPLNEVVLLSPIPEPPTF